MLQVTCKLKYGTSVETYSDLAYLAFGSIGKFAVDFSLFTSQIGCCVAYLLFVGKQFDQVICFETSETFCGKKSDYIMIGALVLIPVCCLKTFRFISYMSGFANLSIVFASKPLYFHLFSLVTIIVIDSVQNAQSNPDELQNLNYFAPWNLPMFFGIAVFAFEGNGVIQSLHNSMRNPEHFDQILKILMAVIISLVISVGTIAYAVSISERWL